MGLKGHCVGLDEVMKHSNIWSNMLMIGKIRVSEPTCVLKY